MNCKFCNKEMKKNKHGMEKKFCSPKCRDYYNYHNLGSRAGDIFRQIERRTYAKISS